MDTHKPKQTQPTPTDHPWPAVVAHLDLDCFFAQAEELDDPKLRGRPVIVGPPPPSFHPDGTLDTARSGRGIVCTANYPARALGVRTAMPAARAHRLAPNAHYRKPRGERYRQLSQQVFNAARDITPAVRPVGIDEAYLDFAGLKHWLAAEIKRSPTPEENTLRNESPNHNPALHPHFEIRWPHLLARRLQAHIHRLTNLHVSVGVGPNRTIAKLASEHDKPQGCLAVPAPRCPAFVAALPLEDLKGVGPATLQTLRKRGITSPAHIVNAPREHIDSLLGDFGTRLWDNAHGLPGTIPPERQQRKSISRDTTFSTNIPLTDAGLDELRATTARLLEKATFTLRREALFAAAVAVRLRFADFTELARERALARHNPERNASDRDDHLRPLAYTLLAELADHASQHQRAQGVRLVGVKLSRLNNTAATQLELNADTEQDDRRQNLHRVADDIRSRLGAAAITSAAAINAARAHHSRTHHPANNHDPTPQDQQARPPGTPPG